MGAANPLEGKADAGNACGIVDGSGRDRLETGIDEAVANAMQGGESDTVEIAAEYVKRAAEATKRREDFVGRGIRQSALGMIADTVIKTSAEKIQLHSLVRVNFSSPEISSGLRRMLKIGIKRAKDLPEWTQDVFIVIKVPNENGVLYTAQIISDNDAIEAKTVKVSSHDLLRIKLPDLSADEVQIMIAGGKPALALLETMIDVRPSGFRPYVASAIR
jgi:hypothetical protein